MHILLAALVGAIAGPFTHHIAVQAGADLSFALSAAACRRCGASSDLVSTCDSCGLSPWRAWLTSVATALLAVLAAWRFGSQAVVGAYIAFAVLTVALFLTDIDHKRIPNRISYPGTVATAALLAVTAWIDGETSAVPRALVGGLVYAAAFGLIYLAARGGFGFGDVKLAVSLGIFTAFVGWRSLFVAGLATAAVGGLVALAAVLFARAGAKTEIPYGPPMIIGSWIAIVGGSELVSVVF